MGITVKKRRRFFLVVEGESEQSFVAWLQRLSQQKELQVHLDGHPLGGGGFKSMLQKAVRLHDRLCRTKGAYRDRFLLVDKDRAEHGDWPIDQLRLVAARHKMTVCVQNPNYEGLLLRMKQPGEGGIPDPASAEAKLKACWPTYQKPVNAHTLDRHFSLADLLRVARVEADLRMLLERIGLIQ